MTIEEMKKWIDEATYESLLRKWRFAKSGDPWFQGAIGEYYRDRMFKLREEIGNAEHVATSKAIGWDG